MTMLVADTIVAISTASGRGGIGIVRISGAGVQEIAQQVLHATLKARYVHFGGFYDAHGEIIDSGLALFFEAPASFTGEDILELHAHGSPVVLQRLLNRICTLGAHLAGPGEFSRRAFEHDKYDLTQLEAIADLINSVSIAAAKSAQRSLQGEFSKQLSALTQECIRLRTHVEAGIDFSDEDIDVVDNVWVKQQMAQMLAAISQLQQNAEQGARLCAGAEIAIVGRPNVGKSSLLNCLAGRDEAIVSELPGTTRDILKSDLVLGGLPIRVLDTAGLRETDNVIEKEGVRRTQVVLKQADLVLLVVDGSVDEQADDLELLSQLKSMQTKWLVVNNKVDLVAAPLHNKLWISAKNGEGVKNLITQIINCLGVTEGAEGAFAARQRHLLALRDATEALGHACACDALEIIAEELRYVQNALATITGEFTTEDLLGEIFSSFCVGK